MAKKKSEFEKLEESLKADGSKAKGRDERLDLWTGKVNAVYKGELALKGADFKALQMARFSSGIFDVDRSLGGGWPFSRICLVAGEESTGKSTLALRALSSVENYDHDTHRHRDFIKEGEPFTPGMGLFVDMEGTFDREWAIAQGVDIERHVVSRPEYAEQAVDIISSAIRENIFDLIVLDSVAAMTPRAEIEDSAEDMQVGAAARIMNKALRKWVASLNRLSQERVAGGPMLLMLNQFRINIGQMFGDPRTLPGGKAQRFAPSILMYTKSASYEDTKNSENTYGTFGGVSQKNKTYVPRMHYQFRLYLEDIEDHKKGDTDCFTTCLALAEKYKIIKQVGAKWQFGTLADAATKKELVARIRRDEKLFRFLWRSVIKTHCGVLV